MLPVDLSRVSIDRIEPPQLDDKNIEIFMLRLDKIHPVISGNKWFKLKYHLENFKHDNFNGILTFGGAYSNHIVATAYTAKLLGIRCAAIIRGEKPAELSQTLEKCIEYGMQLEFVARDTYRKKNLLIECVPNFPGYYTIPEGGAGEFGEKGCREILDLINKANYSHVACAVGTGTMFIGLANSSLPEQNVIGISVLKGMKNLPGQFNELVYPAAKKNYCKIFYDYHGGGYARHTPELLAFMNDFYLKTGIPTDFVYTGKLLYAIMDLVKEGYFPKGSRILIIHSGGLQGNISLSKGTLIF